MSRRKLIAGITALAVVAALAGGWYYLTVWRVAAVTTATAGRETIRVLVNASGTLEAGREADVYPAVAGTLAAVFVRDGQRVRAGQPLAVLDPAPLRLAVAQARKQLAEARAQVDEVGRSVPTRLDRAAVKAQLKAARIAYAAAVDAYDDFDDNPVVVPPPDPETLETMRDTLRTARAQAYAGLLAAKAAKSKLARATDVAGARAAARAGVAAASDALALAESDLAGATVESPISGVVLFDKTSAKPAAGAAVAPTHALFTVVDLSDLKFTALVDEADIGKVEAGMSVATSLDAFPSQVFSGTVIRIRPSATETATGGVAFPVVISVSPGSSRLLLGMSGSAEIEVSVLTDAITVPAEAVLDERGQQFVYRLRPDGRVAKTPVVAVRTLTGRAHVLSGLSAGDVVVTAKLAELSDGTMVRQA